ncbi:phage head-tail connector protein [Streptococcus pneumoniae]|nr:phage head-tail connector protein [Streptococcus pneumoniae]HEU3854573.1 phage head-tail connector protein [Streptococcus pneumoniae]
MDQGQLLELLKLKLGISTDLRDKPLKKIISSVITELTDNLGIELVGERADHEMFRYEGGVDMPRHLQWRLHNLQIASKKEVKNVES